MRAELAGVGAEVLYFFQSDLNICVCYLQPSLQPPGQSVLPDFFLFLFFLKEKSELNLAGRKAKLCPVTTKAVLWSTKPCGAVANTCVLSSRTLGGFCFLFSFNLLLLIVAYGSVMVLLLFFYFQEAKSNVKGAKCGEIGFCKPVLRLWEDCSVEGQVSPVQAQTQEGNIHAEMRLEGILVQEA